MHLRIPSAISKSIVIGIPLRDASVRTVSVHGVELRSACLIKYDA